MPRNRFIVLSEEKKLLHKGLVRNILGLGYSQPVAEAFAVGYMAEFNKLPYEKKIQFLYDDEPTCLRAGLRAAEISEASIAKRKKMAKSQT